MVNQSITLLPIDKTDAEGVTKSLQTTLTTVNELLGVTGAKQTTKLSSLEQTSTTVQATIPAIVAGTNNALSLIAKLQTTQTELSAQVNQLSNALELVNQRLAFQKLRAKDFNSNAWSSAQGLMYESALGSTLTNPPAGVTLSGASTYLVFMEVVSLGAFWQRLQLIGNGQNRVFMRAGSSFSDAVANLWKEL